MKIKKCKTFLAGKPTKIVEAGEIDTMWPVW